MKQVIAMLAALMGTAMAMDASAWAHRETDSGKVVRWDQREVVLFLDPSLELIGSMDAIEASVNEILDLWAEEADLPMDFVVLRGACGQLGYIQSEENFNCLMADEFFGREGEDVGATTMLTFKSNTGAIVDADIVLNAQRWRWSVGGEVEKASPRHERSHSKADNKPASVLSFEIVLAHELGHFLGMAHSELDDAIMYPTTKTGAFSHVQLSEDDIDGVVTLYVGLEDKLATREGIVSGCQAAPGRATSGLWSLALLLLGMLFFVRKFSWQAIRVRRLFPDFNRRPRPRDIG